ncbi:MAG: sugar transferase [Calditrichaeota bacterium]|nr:MAG: sugar transferase [Calditrichota bacterium]
MTKRFFDLVVSILGLLLLSPIFAVVAIFIKLDSEGPVFFRQERMGKGGRIFRIFKFRTMVKDAPRRGAPITVGQDARVTRVGAILRQYKIDELPQLLNVALGHMSLVGPRPELPRYKAHYSGPFNRVLSVRPGITDPASIAFRDESSLLEDVPDPEEYYQHAILPEKLRMNLDYLSTASFWHDLQVILRTVRVAAFPQHAK